MDGPKPAISSVMPAAICDAQKDITLTLTGTGFSPEVQNGLTSNPIVKLPTVTLVSSSGQQFAIPDADISFPDTTGDSLTVIVPQSLVAPGTYSIEVTNPNTNSSTLAGAVTVHPPPTITSVAPSSGSPGATVTVTVTGTGFLPGMTVTLDAMPPVAGTSVTVSADGTTAMVTFDLTGVAGGTYSITVDNHDGCTATLMGAFTVGSEFTITGIDPPFGCTCSDTNVTISSNGGFASTPSVEMVLHGTTSPVYSLKRVAFVTTSTITAVVPSGLPLGTYDVTVTNPPSVGTFGTLPNAFRVVQMPVPEITDVVPSRAPASTSVPLDIYGSNFRTTATVQFVDTTNTPVGTAVNGTVVNSGHITVTITTPGTNGPYLVRVTDTDEMTYSDWSAFIVGSEGASGKLNAFTGESSLVTGRRMLGGVGAEDDLGNFFLYAIGGDTGGASPTVLDSVEVAQQGKFGGIAAWHQEKLSNNMTTTRDAPVAVAVPIPQATDPCAPAVLCFPPVKTYIYVVGGRNQAGMVLGSIERAMVLRNADAPVVTTAAASASAGSLATGTWYYKVSAVLAASDPDNPGGETLPSDEAIVTLTSAQTGLDLAWNPVTGAVGYKVYRTATVNGASQGEVLIATPTGTSYTDTGATAGTEVPLPPGALGTWAVQGQSLGQARWGHQAAVVVDNQGATGGSSLYVLGGMSDAANGVLATVERSPIDATAGTLGTFAAGGDTVLPTAIAFFSLVVESAVNVSGFATGAGGSPARFITVGGVVLGTGTGAASAELTSSNVTAGGGNGAWSAYGGAGTSLTRGGDMGVIASNKLFWLGGAGAATLNPPAFTNIRLNGDNVAFAADGTFGSPIQSTANAFPAGHATALGVPITVDNFIYFVGGTSDGTDAVGLTWQTF
jgi:hypothetical protein